MLRSGPRSRLMRAVTRAHEQGICLPDARTMAPLKRMGRSFVMLGFLETMGGRHVEPCLDRRRGVLLPLHGLEVEIWGLGGIGIVRAKNRSRERVCPWLATQDQSHVQ